jgi:ribosome-associated protein
MPRKTKAVALATEYLDEAKAEDIEVVDVKDKTPFTDFYIIATAPNARALEAFSSDLEDLFIKAKIQVRRKEGIPESGWVIIDAGSVICQLFTSDKRSLFGLDNLLARGSAKK